MFRTDASDDPFAILARRAAAALDTPFAFASVVLETHAWLRAHHGGERDPLARCQQLAELACAGAVPISGDARPMTPPGLSAAAYAAAPMLLDTGGAIGALVVLTRVPRVWSTAELAQLADYAALGAALLHDRLLAAALDATDDAVALTDAADRFIYVNPAHARQYGFDDPAEMIGLSWTQLRPERVHQHLREECGAALRAAGVWRGRSIAQRRDGAEFPQEVTLTRLPTGGSVATKRDISERLALEAEAARAADLRARADAASAAKSALLTQVSHEIRTPLNAVTGLASVLSRTALSDKQRELVGLIESSSQTIERLLADILDLSQIEAGKLTLAAAPFDLATAIAAVAGIARVRADEKNLPLTVSVHESARGLFRGDEFRVRQILLNLLSNAVKFTERGEVRLTAAAHDARGATELEISIADTGVGFDPATAEHLFQRYTQADSEFARAHGGIGMGLAICRALAEAMGGFVAAASTRGAGSVFTLRFPAARVAAARRPAQAPQRLRILVADDHPTNRKVIEFILDGLAADISFVDNGADAVAARRAQDFDIILMDMRMPGMSGVEALKAIRAFESATGADRTPIAMISAHVRADQGEIALNAGADLYIPKPLTADALIKGIENAIRAGQRKVEPQESRQALQPPTDSAA